MPKAKGDEGGFMKFLWNSDTGEFLGRTGSSWGKIIVFYIVFFAGLAAFFLLMLYIFFLTLDLQKPKWQMTNGLIGDNPGVGFRPQPDQDKNVDSTLIWFDRNRKENYEFWSNQLVTWFNDIPKEGGSDVTKCSFGNGGTDTYKDKNKKREQISSCFVDNKQFGECNPENKFGYRLGEPCILVKLNRIYNWEPIGFGLNGKTYNQAQFTEIFDNEMREHEKDIENNPQQGMKPMPAFLQDYIKKQATEGNDHSPQWRTDFLNSVFISCEGENPADKENIGPISYYPHPYIPSYYFPNKRNETFVVKRSVDTTTAQRTGSAPAGPGNTATNGKALQNANLDDTQTLQIKNVLAECLQNLHQARKKPSFEERSCKMSLAETCKPSDTIKKIIPGSLISKPTGVEPLPKASLLRSYLSGSNPSREEYVSRSKNVSNSLISSDSIHHSIFLESGRERRQCLLQYLSKMVFDGQVVIYANSIPGVESLMSFLTKHGFQVNMVFAVLLCAEDHYHSCPAHFRWVKTIINYELPMSSPLENWTIRNGIVEFSDNLPVHIYTFIKKTCPLDNELVKLFHLDSEDQEEPLPVLSDRA